MIAGLEAERADAAPFVRHRCAGPHALAALGSCLPAGVHLPDHLLIDHVTFSRRSTVLEHARRVLFSKALLSAKNPLVVHELRRFKAHSIGGRYLYGASDDDRDSSSRAKRSLDSAQSLPRDRPHGYGRLTSEADGSDD